MNDDLGRLLSRCGLKYWPLTPLTMLANAVIAEMSIDDATSHGFDEMNYEKRVWFHYNRGGWWTLYHPNFKENNV